MRLLVVFAAALLLAACSSRVPPPATPTPGPSGTFVASSTPAPTPSPVAIPDFLAGVEIRPLRIDRDANVTNMTNLIIELGCTQCDGPTTGFARVYGSHGTGFDILMTPEMLPLPPAAPDDQRYIAGFGFAADGSDLIAGVCVHGYCGGMGGPTANAEVWLFRSTDGGITWSDFEHLPRPEFVAGWLGPGSVLTSYMDGSGTSYFTVRPSGQSLAAPVNAPKAWPTVTGTGEVLWYASAGLLRSDGRTYAGTGQSELSFGKPLVGDKRNLLPLSWSRGSDSGYYLAELDPDGSVRRAFTADGWINPEAWMSPVSDGRIFASVPVPASRYRSLGGRQFVGSLPAVIDLGSATVLPISNPFLDGPFQNGRNHVVAVQQGPLVRVKDTGDCLNVRTAPDDGEVLECVRDNVILRDTGESANAGGLTWARVQTPSGTEGWSAAQYLEQ